MPTFVSDRRLYLTADRKKVVEEGDEDAAFLLVGEGGTVSEEDANKYNLRLKEQKELSPLEQEQEALAAAEERGATEEARMRRRNVADLEAEGKAMSEPPANKAKTMRTGMAGPEAKSD